MKKAWFKLVLTAPVLNVKNTEMLLRLVQSHDPRLSTVARDWSKQNDAGTEKRKEERDKKKGDGNERVKMQK